MDATTALIWILSANTIGIALGFVWGKIHERWEWNKLIQKGIIPKPKKYE